MPRHVAGSEHQETRRIELFNATHEPVYSVIAYLVSIYGAGPKTGLEAEQDPASGAFRGTPRDQWPKEPSRKLLSVLPPGRYSTLVPPRPTYMSQRHGIEVAFTDRSGVHWLRASDGSLTELSKPPPDYTASPTGRSTGRRLTKRQA